MRIAVISVSFAETLFSGGSKEGGPRRTPTPHGLKCFQFHTVFRKIWQNPMLVPLLRGILDLPLLFIRVLDIVELPVSN